MFLLILSRRFGQLLGHILSVAGVSTQLSFYDMRILTPRPTPNMDGQGVSLCPGRRSKLVWYGWAAACIDIFVSALFYY
jgi:hypothetical protein